MKRGETKKDELLKEKREDAHILWEDDQFFLSFFLLSNNPPESLASAFWKLTFMSGGEREREMEPEQEAENERVP